ncbi:DUF6804 family protein [Mesorhizobium sp. BR1-1-6]|uniref:DUF6804 family protein n=1 Tax=Mesorhizobium sp. BR1-1-6 TaxID=2876648 RepID=UPI00398D5DB1
MRVNQRSQFVGACVWSCAIFNPFAPVRLPRELWAVLNVGAAALFGIVAYRHRG